VVLDFVMPVATKMIETKAIRFWINDVEKLGFEGNELRGVNLALEDGILNTLAVVETGLGDPAESRFSRRRGGGNVVGGEDIHEDLKLKFEISDYFARKAG
jgi:hypothetical protein